ncbi:MAG: hypothetical protein ACO3NK_09725, partial [Prochlorotrichaceae cyanobacterium]
MSNIDRLHRAQRFFERLAINVEEWQNPSHEHLPLTHFLIAVSIVLHGVMVIDGEVHWTEEQLIQQILGEFWESNGVLEQTISKFLEDINLHKLYLNPVILEHLSGTLVDEEKCLILALGCSLSVIDGYIDPRENLYLQNLAQRLNISLRVFDLIQSVFEAPDTIDAQRAAQLKQVLSPDILAETAPPLQKIALDIL